MSQRWIIPVCLLVLGSAGTCDAAPRDSADTVYIDGLPCNRACQSYMAWSRSITRQMSHGSPGRSFAQPDRRSANATQARQKRLKAAGSIYASRTTVPKSVAMPPARVARSQPAGNADTPAPAVAQPPANTEVASGSATRTVRDQIAAATALAERLSSTTAIPAPELKSENGEQSNSLDSVQQRDTETTGSASPNYPAPLVALLMARPEINSVSDLSNREIAIEDARSASSGSLRTAIASAGADEVQLSDGHGKPIDRLLNGEVPAAVLTLVSPEAAAVFPDVAGFKTFRIPLSAASEKARL
jgi:hypothetical protein